MSSTVEVGTKCKPFLKWAGGKGQLLKDIEGHLPMELRAGKLTKYVEPFVGGGAVFFYIAQKYTTIERFYLLDVNADLINCYKAVKENVDDLIACLTELEAAFLPLDEMKRKEFYLNMRLRFNAEKQEAFDARTASMLIFLNRTCFNGLYRVNKKGLFNVPYGRYKNPRICNEVNLRSASEILQRARIICGDFMESETYIDENTFVYFDPPYRPLSPTANFTAYSKGSFSEEDQLRLAQFCKLVCTKNAKLLLSNSDPKNENPGDHFFEDQYKKEDGFFIDRVKAARAINCKGTGRGQIKELLITNYS
ncbi:MAG: DNA adenine methylase [Deltaproteobacteria bacterium]|nr:DNA adenine methylase [Deltaproteobacteria bacterium]